MVPFISTVDGYGWKSFRQISATKPYMQSENISQHKTELKGV